MSEQWRKLRASLRESHRSIGRLLLSECQTAHAFLDLALTTKDERWSERLIQHSFETLRRMDEFVVKLDVDGDERASILNARNQLAERLRAIGRQFPTEK